MRVCFWYLISEVRHNTLDKAVKQNSMSQLKLQRNTTSRPF